MIRQNNPLSEKTTFAFLACLMLGNTAFGMGKFGVDIDMVRWYAASPVRGLTGFGSGAVLGGLLGYYVGTKRVESQLAGIKAYASMLNDLEKELRPTDNFEFLNTEKIDGLIRVIEAHHSSKTTVEWALLKEEWNSFKNIAYKNDVLAKPTIKRMLTNAHEHVTNLMLQARNLEVRHKQSASASKTNTALGWALGGSLLGGLGYYLAATSLFNK